MYYPPAEEKAVFLQNMVMDASGFVNLRAKQGRKKEGPLSRRWRGREPSPVMFF